jgi:hypothetical protein
VWIGFIVCFSLVYLLHCRFNTISYWNMFCKGEFAGVSLMMVWLT